MMSGMLGSVLWQSAADSQKKLPPDGGPCNQADLGWTMALKIQTRALTKAHYDEIVSVIDQWWGGPTTALAHPIFFYELGERSLVAELGDSLVGFLFGFVCQKGTLGYVHLVGIHPDHRRKRIAHHLYMAFEDECRKAGCTKMKAITTPANEPIQRFHASLGWKREEVRHYAGPDRVRVVHTHELSGGRL